MRAHLAIRLCTLCALALALASGPAWAGVATVPPFDLPTGGQPGTVPPFSVPPVADPPGDVPPFGLPPLLDLTGAPLEISVVIDHPQGAAFGLSNPIFEFHFSPGEGPPTVPHPQTPSGMPSIEPSVVPEPNTIGMLVMAGGWALLRSRRTRAGVCA